MERTEGPWKAEQIAGSEWLVWIEPNLYIEMGDDERSEGDAKLVAAAPDLLAALEAVYDGLQPDNWLPGPVMAQVMRAIEKAKGTTDAD